MNIRRENRRREEPTIELTPLIDVVFLLLIFFLITTSFARDRESAIPIDLAEASAGSATTEGRSFTLSVTGTGGVVVDGGEAVSGQDLQQRLLQLHEENPDARVLLRGDKEAAHGRILEILNLVKETGFTSVDMVVRAPATADE